MKVRHLRHGTTLIEVLGTLSVLLVVATASIGILGAITEVGVRAKDGYQTRASAVRLERTFRADVIAASKIALKNDDWPLEILNGDDTVKYDWEPQSHAISRSIVRQNQQAVIDHFRMSTRFQPRVSVATDKVALILRDGQQLPWVIEVPRK